MPPRTIGANGAARQLAETVISCAVPSPAGQSQGINCGPWLNRTGQSHWSQILATISN